MFWHISLNGKVSWVYYWLRKLIVKPAPMYERCIMGGPVDPRVHCPRHAADDLFCRWHERWGWWP